jgi:hypothetical protein
LGRTGRGSEGDDRAGGAPDEEEAGEKTSWCGEASMSCDRRCVSRFFLVMRNGAQSGGRLEGGGGRGGCEEITQRGTKVRMRVRQRNGAGSCAANPVGPD